MSVTSYLASTAARNSQDGLLHLLITVCSSDFGYKLVVAAIDADLHLLTVAPICFDDIKYVLMQPGAFLRSHHFIVLFAFASHSSN